MDVKLDELHVSVASSKTDFMGLIIGDLLIFEMEERRIHDRTTGEEAAVLVSSPSTDFMGLILGDLLMFEMEGRRVHARTTGEEAVVLVSSTFSFSSSDINSPSDAKSG